MHSRYSPIARVCGILLLLLAVSPVTAPFSTWDPGVLYHDVKTAHGASAVKAGADDPVLAPDGRLEVAPASGMTSGPLVAARRSPAVRPLLDLPLRL
jgi:hypothetical protein